MGPWICTKQHKASLRQVPAVVRIRVQWFIVDIRRDGVGGRSSVRCCVCFAVSVEVECLGCVPKGQWEMIALGRVNGPDEVVYVNELGGQNVNLKDNIGNFADYVWAAR